MIKKYAVLFFVMFGVTCTIKNVKGEQPDGETVQHNQVMATEESSAKSITKNIERNIDISAAVQYLALYRRGLDTIVSAIETAAAQVTPEQDGQEALQKLDHVVIDAVHKFGGLDAVQLPENVYEDVLKALSECQVVSLRDLAEHPLKGVKDYVEFMKRTYASLLISVVTVLDQYYVLTDEAIASYVQQFGTSVAIQEVAPAQAAA